MSRRACRLTANERMSETENILQTIKTTIQDLVAPDVRELKARMTALESRMGSLEARIASVEGRMGSLESEIKAQFEAFQRQSDAQFRAIMAALQQKRAEVELLTYKQIAALSERVAALEAHRQ